jgi:ATPase subunit of ABC transporter with duplicated ATPase domains
MSLIQLVAVFKALGNHQIFDQINFAINSNDLIALIGDNGAGKSTLLKIIAGEIPIDAGKVIRSKNLTSAFLQQEVTISNPMISTKEYLQDTALKELNLRTPSALAMGVCQIPQRKILSKESAGNSNTSL